MMIRTTYLKLAPFPNSLAAALRGFTFYLAVPISSIETLSAPALLAATFAALPSVSLLPAAPLPDDTDDRNDEAA
jgi:hypothetical protein